MLHRFPFLSLELAKEIIGEEVLDFIECSHKLRRFFKLLLRVELSACIRFHPLFGAINQEARVNRCVNDDSVDYRSILERNKRYL